MVCDVASGIFEKKKEYGRNLPELTDRDKEADERFFVVRE
jgi:hypothetical protein